MEKKYLLHPDLPWLFRADFCMQESDHFNALNNKVLTSIHDKGNRHSKGTFSSETWETEGKKSQEENQKILRVHRKKLYGPECKRLLNYNC